jgi:hypothetical protein
MSGSTDGGTGSGGIDGGNISTGCIPPPPPPSTPGTPGNPPPVVCPALGCDPNCGTKGIKVVNGCPTCECA